jgi:membrane protease YdiL (CAAX protease family)
MSNPRPPVFFRLLLALILGIFISVIALEAPGIMLKAKSSFVWLPAALTHSIMWILSLAAIGLLSRGNLASYGLTKGDFRLGGRIFLWVIPTAILSTLGFIASRFGVEIKGGLGYSPLQTVIFVWIYATISEEVFTRGLLQSYLIPLSPYGINLSKRLRLSLPVIFSGLYFGMMHIVAIKRMGPPVVLFTTLLGLVAGYYREKTRSLIPAMMIHALFNVGGSLPKWILSWIF